MIKTHHRIDGKTGPWVTFITGIANDITMWDGQVPALAANFRILRYDLRGQGQTPPTEPPYSIDMLAKDLIDLWDSLDIQKSHLVGLGLGGSIAQAAAIDYPDRIDKLAPCCCRAQMVPDFAALWHELIANVKTNGIEPIVEPTAQRWFSEEFKKANPGVLDGVRKMIRATSVQRVSWLQWRVPRPRDRGQAAENQGAHAVHQRRRGHARRAAGADGRSGREGSGRKARVGAGRRAHREHTKLGRVQ